MSSRSRLIHPANAASPNRSTPSANVAETRLVQPVNALARISLTDDGTYRSRTADSANAHSPMAFTAKPSSCDGISKLPCAAGETPYTVAPPSSTAYSHVKPPKSASWHGGRALNRHMQEPRPPSLSVADSTT